MQLRSKMQACDMYTSQSVAWLYRCKGRQLTKYLLWRLIRVVGRPRTSARLMRVYADEKPIKIKFWACLVSMGQLKLNKHVAERGHRFKKTQNNKC